MSQHSGCGAMKGVMESQLEEKLPHTAAWLCQCKPLLKNITTDQPDVQLKQLIQANILEQIERLKSYDFIKERVENNTLTLHAWYYEFETSEIYVYNFTSQEFVSFEQTIEEQARLQLETIVNDEVLRYLNRLVALQLGHSELLDLCNELEKNNISSIWPDIKVNISTNAQQKLGDLFAINNVSENTQLNELVQERQYIRAHDLSSIREKLTKSSSNSEAHLHSCTQSFYQSSKRQNDEEFTSSHKKAKSTP